MKEKILGGLIGGAIGDAMGAATETRSKKQIIERFGGLVTDIITPPEDVFARGFPKGSVTDDFSLAYYTAKTIIENQGRLDNEVAKEALINWSNSKYYVLAGPTTIRAIEQMKGSPIEARDDFVFQDNGKGTNGAAMKIAPAAYIAKGNIDKAIKNAITISLPTHDNSTSLAGACAIAAAIAKAMHENATIDDIVEASLHGALVGENVGKKVGKALANPSVYKRIKLAVSIAKKSNSIDECANELIDIIGAGISAAEAIPSAIGLVVASKGNAMDGIIAAVNIGNDTDTVATMVGYILGTLNGYSVFDPKYKEMIEEVNAFDLEGLAFDLERLASE